MDLRAVLRTAEMWRGIQEVSLLTIPHLSPKSLDLCQLIADRGSVSLEALWIRQGWNGGRPFHQFLSCLIDNAPKLQDLRVRDYRPNSGHAAWQAASSLCTRGWSSEDGPT